MTQLSNKETTVAQEENRIDEEMMFEKDVVAGDTNLMFLDSLMLVTFGTTDKDAGLGSLQTVIN